MKKLLALALVCGILVSCKKKTEDEPEPETPTTTGSTAYGDPQSSWPITGSGPHLIFKFKFDSTQARLDNLGNSSSVAAGNAAYSPVFNKMAAHYLELAQTDFTLLGDGKILYHAPETTQGGSNAIQFSQSTVVKEDSVFFAIPLSQFQAGDTYKWLRLSLSYQNYDIPYKSVNLPTPNVGHGTIASFLGFKTYVERYKIKDQYYVPSAAAPVNGPYTNHAQGYWGFETYIPGYGPISLDGQSSSATTVVNPNFANSPIPAGSCVVTAVFTDASGNPLNLTIPSNPTHDIVVTVSLSTNKSFEWHEVNADGYYQPDAGEFPVDMGIRGMIPKVQY